MTALRTQVERHGNTGRGKGSFITSALPSTEQTCHDAGQNSSSSNMPGRELIGEFHSRAPARAQVLDSPLSFPASPSHSSSSSLSSASSCSASSSASSSSASSSSASSSPSRRSNRRPNKKTAQSSLPPTQSLRSATPHSSSRRDEARVAKLRRALSKSYCVVNCIHSRADFERNRQHHAVLFQAMRLDNHSRRRVYAVWVAPKRHGRAVERLRREARILHGLKHRNIVRFYHAADEANGAVVTVSLEYCPRGSAADAARRTTAGIPELQAVALIRGALRALRFAHASGIAHGDVRPNAILVAADNSIRLSGFHRAITFRAVSPNEHNRLASRQDGIVDQAELENGQVLKRHEEEGPGGFFVEGYSGHVEFAPPEALSRRWHDARAADIWAAGISLYVLLTRSLRFGNSVWLKVTPDGHTTADIGALMAHPLVAATSPSCQRMLRALLTVDPERRPSAHDALELCDDVFDSHTTPSIAQIQYLD